MLCHRVARELLAASPLALVRQRLAEGADATLSCARSGRVAALMALFEARPRPILYVVSSEESAERQTLALRAWLGAGTVLRYPDRRDLPWQERKPDLAVVGRRARAVGALAANEPVVVVASARALLRRLPPAEAAYYRPVEFAVGDEVPLDEVAARLIASGYVRPGDASEPGTFDVRGDIVDVFPADATHPVRLEFFGDELDRIREVVVSTGQTIGELERVSCSPAAEFALTDDTRRRAERALKVRAQDDRRVAADLEAIRSGIPTLTIDCHLEALYGRTAEMAELAGDQTLVVLSEPRALFDDCLRYATELAEGLPSGVGLEGLMTDPRALAFGGHQQLHLISILGAGGRPTAELECRQPQIAGSDARMLARIRALLDQGYGELFCVPDRQVRSNLMMSMVDAHIPVVESLGSAPENRDCDLASAPSIRSGVVTFTDAEVPHGVVLPDARLAIFSVDDLTQRKSRARRGRAQDVTEITFPFEPGDYVVHETYGIAKFARIERMEVDGRERDYFLLEYAASDKLYVPLELVDRLTRYVGPDGAEPRVTRLHSADWSRATAKARANAKRLAFDLVDLYARRAQATGHPFGPDTAAQLEMEAAFPYELTADQALAIDDIKADMEEARPMDRLLCGDVGFGKTEVALRAAFKCVQDARQVMVLCPTTILAQQHFETFSERFEGFGVRVAVLSRFRIAAEQRRDLEAFAKGEIDVLIGTHRLLSADVNPRELGLVIIDEEQRFGVGHKEQLKNLREQVDVLSLSATPIPRTMSMALSGVRDMSLIMEAPAGRRPVKVVVGQWDEDLVSNAIRRECARGGQVYYVSNRVADIDEAVARVVEAAPEARIGIAHGQMAPREVEAVMARFAERKVDVLVATTIIESGIDNPHTNTLVIEDSQRLGLAQLYQLKGRVGRGRVQAYAYFLFPGEVPLTREAIERLTAINELQELGSGLRIAMRDLEIRGAGSLLGAEQSGNLSNVGFDLYTQMIGDAVAEARGEVPEAAPPDVAVNIPADYYLSDDYIPEVDRRVLAYRRLAATSTLAEVDRLEAELEERWGPMEEAGRNLMARQRVRIRAQRLGVDTLALAGGRLSFQGLRPPKSALEPLKAMGCVVFPKSAKVTLAFKRDSGNPLATAIEVLELCGGDDDEE